MGAIAGRARRRLAARRDPRGRARRSARSGHRLEPVAEHRRRRVRRRFEGDQSRLGDRRDARVRPADRADRRRQGEGHRFRRDGQGRLVAREGRRADRRGRRRDRRRRQARQGRARGVDGAKRSRARATSRTPGDVVLLSPGCASFDMFRRPSTAAKSSPTPCARCRSRWPMHARPRCARATSRRVPPSAGGARAARVAATRPTRCCSARSRFCSRSGW